MVLVLVATVVMVVVMDPVDPSLDRCARRSSRCRSHSHQSRNGRRWWDWWWWWSWWWWLLVWCGGGCSFGVVMGATRKCFYHVKRFHGGISSDPLPPSIYHGRSFLPMTTSSSVTLRNRLTRRTLHGSFFLIFNFFLFFNIKLSKVSLSNLDY